MKSDKQLEYDKKIAKQMAVIMKMKARHDCI